MKRTTRYLVAALIIIACVAADRGTKSAAAALRGEPPARYLGGTVTLLYVENSGAMLSFGASLSEKSRFWVLTVGVGILIAGLLVYLLFGRNLPPLIVAALALMVGGGVSNLYDRMMNDGRVVDFLLLGAGALRTGVFNIADVAITGGVVLFFFSAIARKKSLRQETP
jgi:signal peptidase II